MADAPVPIPAAPPADASAQVAKTKGLQPVHVDGFLYVLMAVAASIVASMSTDQAVKFISPQVLFWVKLISESIEAACMALKMYRSTGYAQSVGGGK